MSPRNPENTHDTRLPPAVTFTSGAELLMQLGIVESITREGVRHIATSELYAPYWPFGPDKPYPYGKANNALIMATEPFLEFFRTVYKQLGDSSAPETT
ncbi:hypothetical protein [Streptomyces lavendofoliae]|uniref:Uncharacterized protein n=1 Tax=Streptomyces lavendofoliae TaxID=67314 RepID=A0A918M7X8_9ACTN|nr:hypothetical protein [Streptomyces lavendofoliae]GGU62531.1 hypothetical protein GCM10010274_59160 [Streptomyces lavendofoliae]